MTTNFFVFLFIVIGIVLGIFLFKNNTEEVKKERLMAIKKKVSSLGGKVIKIDKINREAFNYSDIYDNPDKMYIFYKIRYSVRNMEKVGYGVLVLERNWYGPALSAKIEWMWHF